MADDEFHVVLVGRSGGHAGTNIYVVGPGPKRHAVTTVVSVVHAVVVDRQGDQ